MKHIVLIYETAIHPLGGTAITLFVHCCLMTICPGTSRSPAVVAAAIMKAKGLSLQDALRVLQARVPHAAPNPGFMAQLELWGEMGCQIDEDHPGFKQY